MRPKSGHVSVEVVVMGNSFREGQKKQIGKTGELTMCIIDCLKWGKCAILTTLQILPTPTAKKGFKQTKQLTEGIFRHEQVGFKGVQHVHTVPKTIIIEACRHTSQKDPKPNGLSYVAKYTILHNDLDWTPASSICQVV